MLASDSNTWNPKDTTTSEMSRPQSGCLFETAQGFIEKEDSIEIIAVNKAFRLLDVYQRTQETIK